MVKADTSVKWFHSAMADAPALNGAAGSMIDVLDACLINGFSARTPDSIVVSAGVATVSISAGNPYEKHAVIAISGASDAALNAEWRIDAAAASSFTFVCPGVADGTVTGATVKRASAGWGKPFSGTNKGVYQSTDPASTQLYLRVDDTYGRYCGVRGYEQLTDIDAGAGLFPTTAQSGSGLSWAKSNEANANPKTWAIFGDGRIFYIYQATYGTNNPTLGAFGDIVSFVPNDKYNCIVVGSATFANTAYPGSNTGLTTQLLSMGCYMARRGDQLTNSVRWVRPSTAGVGGGSFPFGYNVSAPLGGETILRAPIFAADGPGVTDAYRGFVPGLLEPLHAAFTGISATLLDGVGPMAGRTLAGYRVGEAGGYGSIAVDITGPWR